MPMTDDNKNPLDPLADSLIDAITLSPDLKKRVAKNTATAYGKTVLAATFIPAVVLLTGGQQSISQEIPIRKPDEHIASQSQPTDSALEGRRMLEATSTSASALSINEWDVLQTSDGVVYVSNGRTGPPDSSSEK
jgi:hypothetical protein